MPETNDRKSRVSLDGRMAKVEKINEVTSEETPRVATNLKELNRVLGGGVVPGSMGNQLSCSKSLGNWPMKVVCYT